MTTRRFVVSLPTPLAEDLSAMATRSGVRPSEVLTEALRQFEPFRWFAVKRGNAIAPERAQRHA